MFFLLATKNFGGNAKKGFVLATNGRLPLYLELEIVSLGVLFVVDRKFAYIIIYYLNIQNYAKNGITIKMKKGLKIIQVEATKKCGGNV
jgi:hypothetical protein